MELIVKPTEEIVQEKVSLRSVKPKTVQVKHEVAKVDLSDNIQKFDRKIKVHTQNPYAFNTVAKKQPQPIVANQTASQMITNPTYNFTGKFLGVDTLHDWAKYYDKVYTITEWAKQKVGNDRTKIAKWLTTKLSNLPSMSAKRIDDLYIAAHLDMERKK